MYSKNVFGILTASISSPCYTIDDRHVNLVGAPSAPKDDAMACMASSLNTPLSEGLHGARLAQLSTYIPKIQEGLGDLVFFCADLLFTEYLAPASVPRRQFPLG